MAVRLRLRRMGKKKQPFYRIVAIDSRAAREGRYIEKLGSYNPLTNPVQIEIKEERALYWLTQGAIPSDTVRSFLRRKGILLKWHLMKKGFDEATIEEECKKWEVLQLERQKRLEALAEQKKREIKKKAPAKTKPETELQEEAEEVTPSDVESVEVSGEAKEEASEKLEEEKQKQSAASMENAKKEEVETKTKKKSKKVSEDS